MLSGCLFFVNRVLFVIGIIFNNLILWFTSRVSYIVGRIIFPLRYNKVNVNSIACLKEHFSRCLGESVSRSHVEFIFEQINSKEFTLCKKGDKLLFLSSRIYLVVYTNYQGHQYLLLESRKKNGYINLLDALNNKIVRHYHKKLRSHRSLLKRIMREFGLNSYEVLGYTKSFGVEEIPMFPTLKNFSSHFDVNVFVRDANVEDVYTIQVEGERVQYRWYPFGPLNV